MPKDKRLKAAYEAVDRTKPYLLHDAIQLVKRNAKAKFSGNVRRTALRRVTKPVPLPRS